MDLDTLQAGVQPPIMEGPLKRRRTLLMDLLHVQLVMALATLGTLEIHACPAIKNHHILMPRGEVLRLPKQRMQLQIKQTRQNAAVAMPATPDLPFLQQR